MRQAHPVCVLVQNRITRKPAYEEDKDIPGEAENHKADRFWRKYLERDNSPITDLFGGQLQSTVHCHKCKGNFTTYEPFWDLSVPIAKEGKTGISAWLSGKTVPTTIQDCLQAFTGDELLQVASSLVSCSVCPVLDSVLWLHQLCTRYRCSLSLTAARGMVWLEHQTNLVMSLFLLVRTCLLPITCRLSQTL